MNFWIMGSTSTGPLAGQCNDLMTPTSILPFQSTVFPSRGHNPLKSMGFLEGRSFFFLKKQSGSRGREVEILSMDWLLISRINRKVVMNVKQDGTAASPLSPFLLFVLHIPHANRAFRHEFYTQFLFLNKFGQHRMRIRRRLWSPTDLDNPSRATDKPNDVATWKNFLNLRVVFY